MLRSLLITTVLTVLTVAISSIASAAPIVGSFSLGLSSGSYIGGAQTAATATGLDFGLSANDGGTGAGNGYGVNGSGVVYNGTDSFFALNNSSASVADLALGAGNVATPYTVNPFITLGSYMVTISNSSYTRSPLGTSVTVAGDATFSDGTPADTTTGTFALSTSSQGGSPSNIKFTFTSNVSAVPNAVPEPLSLSVLGASLAGIGLIRLRRKNQ